MLALADSEHVGTLHIRSASHYSHLHASHYVQAILLQAYTLLAIYVSTELPRRSVSVSDERFLFL